MESEGNTAAALVPNPARAAPENRTAEAGTGAAPAAPPGGGDDGNGRTRKGQFAPGASGNPGGRPKGFEDFTELARKKSPLILTKLTTIALNGKGLPAVRACEIILERAWGKAPQKLEHSGPGGGPVALRAAAMTTEEKRAELRQLQAAARKRLAASGAAVATAPAPQDADDPDPPVGAAAADTE